jgi:hypothetical protein
MNNLPVHVTDSDDGLEAGTLTGRGLLLHRVDGHDLVLEGREEEVNDLVLLDGEREQEDLLHGLDLAVLDETTELGNGNPLLVLVLASTAAGATTTTPTVTTTATTSESTTSTSGSSFSHFDELKVCLEVGALLSARWTVW